MVTSHKTGRYFFFFLAYSHALLVYYSTVYAIGWFSGKGLEIRKQKGKTCVASFRSYVI
jgi:hypothetical protein